MASTFLVRADLMVPAVRALVCKIAELRHRSVQHTRRAELTGFRASAVRSAPSTRSLTRVNDRALNREISGPTAAAVGSAPAQISSSAAANVYTTGDGLAWHEHDPRLFSAVARFYGTLYRPRHSRTRPFVGVDYHDESIRLAAPAAVEAGVGDRVQFEVADGTSHGGNPDAHVGVGSE